jgi:sugar lactone lactonase YvrE
MVFTLFPALSILFALFLSPMRARPNQQAQSDHNSSCELCFYRPDNMVFDAEGNAYITDSDHESRSRVLKVSPDGKKIAEWRVFKKVPGMRNGPEGIAIDHDGNILVTDGGPSRVLKVSPAGKVLGQIGDSRMFSDLGHIAVGSSGNIYVSEAGPNTIQEFSPQGKRIAIWKSAKGSGPQQWNGPETIAGRTDGTLIVEDTSNRRIDVLSPSGHILFSFVGANLEEGINVDHAGNIYAADWKPRRIQKFDASGNLLAIFKNNDSGVPLFTAIPQKDFSNGYPGPAGVTVDEHGNMYTVDGLTIVKLSLDGHLLARWR